MRKKCVISTNYFLPERDKHFEEWNVMASIVYASSEEFAPVLSVSIYSLLRHKAKETIYHVYVLAEKEFSNKYKAAIENICSINNVLLRWIYMGNRFRRTLTNTAGVGKESNYRLLIPEIVEDSSCLYLDADTLILQDISSWISLDMYGCYLAGLHPKYFLWKTTENYTHAHYEKFEQMIKKHIGNLKYDQYIGTGVMLMNLDALREDNMTEKFLREIPLYSGPLDQDILNACCYGKIKILDADFCVDLHETEDIAWYEQHLPKEVERVYQAVHQPNIIHFSDKYKPWRRIGVRYEKKWWEYAFLSGAADELWDILVKQCQVPSDYYEQEVNRIVHSTSYRIGRALTYFPRKLRQLSISRIFG